MNQATGGVIGDQPTSPSSVMSKTLSNGTLSLRFMQNAQRIKDDPEVKPDQATLADDAEWHVPQNVRDAWTSAGPSATGLKSTAVSESSYLPFLFHTEDKVSPSFNGRRSFVKGKEVILQPEPAQSLDPPQPTVPKLEPGSVSGGVGAGRSHRDDALIKPKREKKPVSISGFKSSSSATSSALRSPGKKPTLPASSLIYQDADVGLDLGSVRRAARDRGGFIRPANVDAPPPDSQPSGKSAVSSVVESTPAEAEQKKRTIGGPGDSTQFIDDAEDRSRKKRKR